MESQAFSVALVASIKHAALRKAIRDNGGIIRLAKRLGISGTMLHGWARLSNCPPVTDEEVAVRGGGGWTLEKRDAVAEALWEVTGQTLEQLFPPAIRNNREWLKMSKKVEEVREVPLHALLAYGDSKRQRLTAAASPTLALEHKESREAILHAIRFLHYRSRAIIEARYGLSGEAPMTLEETAAVFKITKERVRQIEARAFRRLQAAGGTLREVVPPHWLEPPPKFTPPKGVSLRQIVEAQSK